MTKQDHTTTTTEAIRSVGVAASASGLAEARSRAYAAVSAIRFAGSQHRTDIAFRALGAT